jgi:hypothetical protein
MKPVYWIVAIVFGAGAVLGWQFLQRPQEAPTAEVGAPARSVAAVHAGAPAPDESLTTAAPVAQGPTEAEQVTRWIVDTGSTDANARSAAIAALARGPREQVLPVLRRVLLNGEPTVDRPLALRSLRDLALAQGDADSAIREALREVIYHGDDESFTANAQDALDAVEQSETNQ